ncbi:MAG: DUF2059 domain-containing protein [Sphingobium sp.]
MRKRLAWMLAGLLLGCGAAHAAEPIAAAALDPVRVEKARAIVTLMVPPEQRQAMFATMIDSYMGNMLAGMMDGSPELSKAMTDVPELKPVFAKFVDRQRNLALKDLEDTAPELMLAYTHAYARAFTAEELDGLAGFFATPVGQKYLLTAPTLLSDPDFGAWQRGVTARAQARQKEELKTLLEEMMPILKAKEAKHHDS